MNTRAKKRQKVPKSRLSELLDILWKALLWRRGYRIASIVLWVVILGLISIPFERAQWADEDAYAERTNYRARCAADDYDGAHAILSEFYADYSNALGRWRTNGYKRDEARIAQERYRAALAYIFGQEAAAIYYDSTKKRDDNALIQLLVTIPTEGAPLSEGTHANGMFYNNDAGANAAAIDHVVYQSWVRFYNDRCEQLLDMALTYNDPQLAKKIIRLYKTEVETRYTPDTVRGDNYSIATVTYNNKRQEQALRRLAEHQQAE